MSSSSTEAERERAPVPDRLWVVLPVYNEAAAIERVVEEWVPVLAAADPAFVLLVIDDGSADATPEALQRLAARDARLRVVRQSNQGHGAACRRGYEIATASSSDADWVLQIDSDGQCDPQDFPAFWQRRQGESGAAQAGGAAARMAHCAPSPAAPWLSPSVSFGALDSRSQRTLSAVPSRSPGAGLERRRQARPPARSSPERPVDFHTAGSVAAAGDPLRSGSRFTFVAA